MKVKFKQSLLLNALEQLNRIAATKNSILTVVMNSYLFTVKKTATLITAHNLEVLGNIAVFSESDSEGIFVIPHNIYNALKEIPSETVEIEVGETSAKVMAGFDEVILPVMNQAEFVRREADYKNSLVSIPCDKTVIESVERATMFCNLADELKPVFGAVCVKVSKGKIIIYGSDGYSMYRNTFAPVGLDESIEKMILVPKALHGPFRGLRKDGTSNIVFSPSTIGVKSPTTSSEYFIRALDLKVPDYERVIPQDLPTKFMFTRADLLKAVEVSSALDTERDRAMVFSLNGKLEVRRENNEKGSKFTTTVKTENFPANANMVLGFNIYYLKKMLNAFETPVIQIELVNPTTAALFRPVIAGKATEESILIMPTKTI